MSEKDPPIAYMRRWAFDGNEGTKGNRPKGWHFQDVTRQRLFSDDVPLFAAPQNARKGESQ